MTWTLGDVGLGRSLIPASHSWPSLLFMGPGALLLLDSGELYILADAKHASISAINVTTDSRARKQKPVSEESVHFGQSIIDCTVEKIL